ncbi:Fasciclin-like arabinogalactan protein [Musa troglodytarum]|uniref:Fasciclin-like arabinogalactan protein n=1 Tax=Musa troglodytarum TaxID=320322 RepID=A0A9E7KZQ8_9LILI|nr:Fasciclin-like arabinogalactan protein [Musa troglodytarum]
MRRVFPLLAASLLLLLAAASAPVAQGHNITKILAGIPEFSTFNHYLTVTHLASEINRRLTITLLAVDNSGMADLLAKHLSVLTLRNVLALHILTDYYGAKKLHQLTGGSTLASSVFQSSGHAPGTTGYINITDHRAGKVTFAAEDSGGAPPVSFVKSVKEMPYNISVLQVSTILSSPESRRSLPSTRTSPPTARPPSSSTTACRCTTPRSSSRPTTASSTPSPPTAPTRTSTTPCRPTARTSR